MTSYIKLTVYADKRGEQVLVVNGQRVRTAEEIKKVLDKIQPEVISQAIKTFHGIVDATEC